MTGWERALRDAWIAEMMTPVPELPKAERNRKVNDDREAQRVLSAASQSCVQDVDDVA